MKKNTNSQSYNERLSIQKTNAYILTASNYFQISVPPLTNSVTCTCTSTSMSALLTNSLLTPLVSQPIAADTVYLSAIQPLLHDNTQTITTTASTIVYEADDIQLTSLNSITLSADTGCNIITPLISLSQDLQVAAHIQCPQIQCTQLQVNQLTVSSLIMSSATLSTFSDPATSSILIQINGAWWKIPIVPA